jgi:hypothetical protein
VLEQSGAIPFSALSKFHDPHRDDLCCGVRTIGEPQLPQGILESGDHSRDLFRSKRGVPQQAMDCHRRLPDFHGSPAAFPIIAIPIQPITL